MFHVGKAGALWRSHPSLGLEVYTLYGTHQDRLSERDRDDPRLNPNGTPGWITTNMRIAWQVNMHFDLAFRAENLADKRSHEHGSGLDEPGRNFILSAAIRFWDGPHWAAPDLRCYPASRHSPVSEGRRGRWIAGLQCLFFAASERS